MMPQRMIILKHRRNREGIKAPNRLLYYSQTKKESV